VAPEHLTPREQETLLAVSRRLTNVEVAAELHVSVRTVESHIASLRRKLLVESRRELIQAAASYAGRPVPRPANAFIGRDDLLARTRGLLTRSRWITLTGSPGIGKSRLALELAVLSPSVVVALEHTPPGGTLNAIAKALGLEETRGPGVFRACCSALSVGPLQLVLDDVDRVGAEAGAVARGLLGQVDSLRVVTTSRTPLHGPGEVIVQLYPLAADSATDPAVLLFLDRARTASPTAELADIPTIVELCRRLDGIPLAIELAAARTRHLSPRELGDRSTDGGDILGTIGDPGRRHAALSTTFAWTWDLLDVELQRTMSQLAGLPGAFDLDLAAAAVGQRVEPEVLTLLDRSLLVKEPYAGDPARFRMLDAMRRFVRGRTDGTS
jgi:predicted ATPase/DNA-binding CsgD family transcriptional regulator